MALSTQLYKKINDEMRIIYITESSPREKIKLDPIDPEDMNVDLELVKKWSPNNKQLYDMIIHNGMAEFICNRQFLNQFYQVLQFMYLNLKNIDAGAMLLTNLKVLNLLHNNISCFQNIPPNCKELYLDFNQISQCNSKKLPNLELLSLSHNRIDDRVLEKIISNTLSLRCLNISYNSIQNIRKLVIVLKKCTKLKLLITLNNPISLLWLYWDYLTEELSLDYFDGKKYVKPEPEIQQTIQQKPPEEKKDDKKDAKGAKKGGKVEEKPPEPEPVKQIKYKEPRVRNQQDYKLVTLKLLSGVFEGFTGNIYDPSLFPVENLDLKQTQSCFWIEGELLNQKISTQEDKISMEQITTQNQINLLQFSLKFETKIEVNLQMLQKVQKGVSLFVWKQEPVVKIDSETGEQSAQIVDGKIAKTKACLGGLYVDLREMMPQRIKKISRNSRLFVKEAVNSPLFQRPYENEEQLISKNRIQFDAKLAQEEEEKRKKIEQEEAAKAQKKGGKDSKKGADKKGAKKEGKEPASDKKVVKRSELEQQGKEYCYLEDGKMFKCLKDQCLTVNITLE